jgi:hypothetical protein
MITRPEWRNPWESGLIKAELPENYGGLFRDTPGTIADFALAGGDLIHPVNYPSN